MSDRLLISIRRFIEPLIFCTNHIPPLTRTDKTSTNISIETPAICFSLLADRVLYTALYVAVSIALSDDYTISLGVEVLFESADIQDNDNMRYPESKSKSKSNRAASSQ